MFNSALLSVKLFFSGILFGIGSLFGLHKIDQSVLVSPGPTVIIAQLSPSQSPTSSPSAKPAGKPKATPSATLSPEIDMDLNLERVFFYPEKMNDFQFGEFKSGNQKLVFKQSSKIKFINIAIRNNGHTAALKTAVKIIADNDDIYQKTIDVIDQQTIKYEKIETAFPSKVGKHKIEVQINPEKSFPEKKFDNNSKTYEYEYID